MNQLELEYNVLGSIMLDDNIVYVLPRLKEYDFTNINTIKVFNALKTITKEQKTPDIYLIGNISGVEDQILLDMQNSISSTANIEEHIRQLRNLTLRRKFMVGSQELAEQMQHSINPANDMVLFSSKLNKLSQYSMDSLETTRRTALDDVREFRDAPPEKRYSFGIKFLDHAFNGYHNRDVITIATRSGRGKSEMCGIIAESAARDKKRVLYLALEAEEGEIGTRIYFRILCSLFFAKNPNLIYPLSYDRWLAKDLPQLDEYEDEAKRIMDPFGGNIFVQYRNTEFTVDDLNQQLNSCNDVDVIILDHIHYVDILESNENKGLKKIIKCIRMNNLLYQKPIIVVAHLRKTNKREDGLVPDEDDIFGSSDLNKIVTKTILFCPDFSELHNNLFRTFFWLSKNRRDSSVVRYMAKLFFNSRVKLYLDKYELGQYKPFAKEFIDIGKTEPEKLPSWYPKEYSYNESPAQPRQYKD